MGEPVEVTMKTFYTERDIVDLHAAGVTEIKLDSEVVLTDLAQEKAEALGVRLGQVELEPGWPDPVASVRPAVTALAEPDLVAQVKARVIARLGTTAYNEVLDQVIPQVLAQLVRPQSASVSTTPATPSANDY